MCGRQDSMYECLTEVESEEYGCDEGVQGQCRWLGLATAKARCMSWPRCEAIMGDVGDGEGDGFTIVFEFAENPFFSNTTLTKKFSLGMCVMYLMRRAQGSAGQRGALPPSLPLTGHATRRGRYPKGTPLPLPPLLPL